MKPMNLYKYIKIKKGRLLFLVSILFVSSSFSSKKYTILIMKIIIIISSHQQRQHLLFVKTLPSTLNVFFYLTSHNKPMNQTLTILKRSSQPTGICCSKKIHKTSKLARNFNAFKNIFFVLWVTFQAHLHCIPAGTSVFSPLSDSEVQGCKQFSNVFLKMLPFLNPYQEKDRKEETS